MTGANLLDLVPLWAFYGLAFLASLGAIEFGVWLGTRRRRTVEHEQEGPVGSVVGAVLGLLAFMLAFTFGVTAARYDTRKQLLLDEVNAIGTAYLRGGLLREPHRKETQNLLREYVDIRANLPNAINRPDGLRGEIARAEALQQRLWSHATAIAEADRSSEIDALFIDALNEVIDLHTKRVVYATQYRVPVVVWGVLAFVSVLGMAVVGFQFGLGGRRNPVALLTLALTFSAVLGLIGDLDRPLHGWLKVSQQPMIDLQQKLRAP